MKSLQTTLLFTTLLMACFEARAATLSPSDCNDPNHAMNCLTASTKGNGGMRLVTNVGKKTIVNAFSVWIGGLEELYKADSKDGRSKPGEESGFLAGSYSTMFDWDVKTGFAGARLTYDGGISVDCALDCYLLVKDGNHKPAAYLFNLALDPIGWGGTMDLVLRDFWPDGGSISHLALYGNVTSEPLEVSRLSSKLNPVPVPAAAWLFGTALIGLAGIRRRGKAAQL